MLIFFTGGSMAFKLKGKEEKFFSILNEHAELCHEASVLGYTFIC